MVLNLYSGSTGVAKNFLNPQPKPVWLNALITNNNIGDVSINLYIKRPDLNQYVKITPKDLTLEEGQSFEIKDVGFTIGAEFKLTTTGSIDYYIILHEDYSKQW